MALPFVRLVSEHDILIRVVAVKTTKEFGKLLGGAFSLVKRRG